MVLAHIFYMAPHPHEELGQRAEQRLLLVRLRQAVLVALVAWPAFAFVDLFIATVVHPGRIAFYLALRALGVLGIALVAIRLHIRPQPAVLSMRALDAGLMMLLCGLITATSIEFRGIETPLVLGVVTLILSRGGLVPDRASRAIVPIGLGALTFPATLLLLSPFSHLLSTQLADPNALSQFALNVMFVGAACVLSVAGSHVMWKLSSRVNEERSLGRYELRSRIGEGGMGDIWNAHDRTLEREVALKILQPERIGDAQAVERFRREARASARLNHPHAVRLFDYGVTETGYWYHAMELLTGRDLGAVVREDGPISEQRAAEMIRQAASALSEAHQLGIVHRDVKPENLFLLEDVAGENREGNAGRDFVKVLDFGLAQLAFATGRLTKPGFGVGTPSWVSPEVIRNQTADARSDVYGLGAVLYYLTTGTVPFSGSVAEILGAHLEQEPELPSTRVEGAYSKELEAVILKCLQKDPAARFSSASELAQSLDRLLSPPEITAVPAIVQEGRKSNVIIHPRALRETAETPEPQRPSHITPFPVRTDQQHEQAPALPLPDLALADFALGDVVTAMALDHEDPFRAEEMQTIPSARFDAQKKMTAAEVFDEAGTEVYRYGS